MAKARTGKQVTTDDDEEEPSELSDAARSEITNLVNAAVSGQLQRKLPKAISDAVATPIGELRTLIESNLKGSRRRAVDDEEPEEEIEEPPPKRGKGARRVKDEDPEKETMRKRLDAIEAERKLEREQNRARDRDGVLRESLTKLGVDANRMRGAVAVLRETTKYDEKTGEWSYVAKREGYDEEIDLSAGAAEWAKTDEGKSYLAPAQTGARGGSGTRVGAAPVIGSGGGGAASRAGSDPKAAKLANKQEAMKQLTEGVNALAGGAITVG